jgi:predicted ATP-dependent endonuclease of OLD family
VPLRIVCVEIANFRKLKSVRIDISDRTTLLVGSNNSGKTTAMEALRQFLVSGSAFRITDFTLSDLPAIKAIGAQWESAHAGAVLKDEKRNTLHGEEGDDLTEWEALLPSLDVWIEASKSELHRVRQLLPILDDYAGAVGVRLRYEPRDAKQLRTAYLARREAVNKTVRTRSAGDKMLKLWPIDLVDFLDRQLDDAFVVRPYKLDPTALTPPITIAAGMVGSDSEGVVGATQRLSEGEEPLESNPLARLIKVDIVNAQRGLGSDENGGRLSKQVAAYYSKHLDFDQKPEPADLDAIQATQHASEMFDERLQKAFKSPLDEVARMGYPGGANPRVVIRTDLRLVDGLKHISVLRYQMGDAPEEANELQLDLPEGMNGLGYQNLVLMIFNLMSFRDARNRVGKASISLSASDQTPEIKPLHLVLIEEPEAHLHPQVQQVFINHAYQTLAPDSRARENPDLTTQLVVSTHSSHIAHEVNFDSIRYFRRNSASDNRGIPTTTVRNLSTVFGDKSSTAKFVQRYLKVQHCDIFFADALVLVEGAAERILLPHFIQAGHPKLRESYVEYLDIGGAHAHRLRGLVDAIGIPTLVITDIDAAVSETGSGVLPALGAGQTSGNSTLEKWLQRGVDLDALSTLTLSQKSIVAPDGAAVQFAYQTPVDVTISGVARGTVLPSTFEDSLALSNLDLMSTLAGTGMLRKFATIAADVSPSTSANHVAELLFKELKTGDKAKFALDILWALPEEASLVAPTYIAEGLQWLEAQIAGLPLLSSAVVDQTENHPTETTTDAAVDVRATT